LVATALGVTILPRLALSPLRAGVVARSLGREAPIRRIWAARPAEGYRSPASEAMVQVLQDVAEEFRAEPELVAAPVAPQRSGCRCQSIGPGNAPRVMVRARRDRKPIRTRAPEGVPQAIERPSGDHE
jgi:hypothetical protein